MEQVSENVYVETEFSGSNNGFITTAEGIIMVGTPMIPSTALKW